MEIKTELIPISVYGESDSARRRGIILDDVTFFVDHDTGNPNSTASGNVSYFISTYNEASASAHIFVDDEEAIMCVPCFDNAERAHHVLYNVTTDNEKYGDDANDKAIGLELCYFPDDIERSQQAYNNYIDVATDLCIFHNVDPSLRSGHFELDPDRKTDPNNALQYIGKTYEDMKADIIEEYVNKMADSWMQTLGEESIDKLVELEILDSPDTWKEKDLENDVPPYWLFFTLMARIAEK